MLLTLLRQYFDVMNNTMRACAVKITFLLFISLFSCSGKQEEKIFLYENDLSKIPDSVIERKELTVLAIGLKGYTIYPPLSALDSTTPQMPLRELPEGIGDLTNLRSLTVNNTAITTLPLSIVKLKRLERLDLSMNSNLLVVNELGKLQLLPNLSILIIFGANVSEKDLQTIKTSLGKKVRIVFALEEFLQESGK